LIDNIGFLYRIMCGLKSTGYGVLAVRKVFDDHLYVYVSGRIREDKILYRGFTLRIFNNFNNIEVLRK